MRFIGVIPARYHSTRLPGKALIEIAGRPLVQWVYEQARQASHLDDLVVATDDLRILNTVEGFGGKAVMTRSDHNSGTDRVAELAQSIEADVFVNIQGDEPLISWHTIDGVCSPFERDVEVQITTARIKISDPDQIKSPHVVKVVVDSLERALYFSRAPIPCPQRRAGTFYKHLGIYGYRREFLQALSQLNPSELEETEGLEQLRFLENGVEIRVVEVSEDSPHVDTRDDILRVRPLLENTLKKTDQSGK
jgi:3-deoxy-manno-octulosonate cytidylyltransferase (CMP-KDO synthetase)